MSRTSQTAFALPMVLIASVVLMMVLAVSVSATNAVRNALKAQYYSQLAQVAGEAGVAYAQACLDANSYVVTWSDANPLTPGTDCDGNPLSGVSCPSDAECWLTINENVRSSFSVPEPVMDGSTPVYIEQGGYVDLWRESTDSAWRTYTQPSARPVVVE